MGHLVESPTKVAQFLQASSGSQLPRRALIKISMDTKPSSQRPSPNSFAHPLRYLDAAAKCQNEKIVSIPAAESFTMLAENEGRSTKSVAAT